MATEREAERERKRGREYAERLGKHLFLLFSVVWGSRNGRREGDEHFPYYRMQDDKRKNKRDSVALIEQGLCLVCSAVLEAPQGLMGDSSSI